MGITCVAICEIKGTQARLLPFVLSCRVFGYGIEHAVLNEVKRRARAAGALMLAGRYVANASNQPCRDFLSDNGFVSVDGVLQCDLTAALTPAAPWLQIQT
jgi:predicted enzyme involved in methoxymalonyl-ACP biosynthesis